MMNKREIFIAELHADKIFNERKFDRYQMKKKLRVYARVVYLGLISILGVIVWLSQILEIPKIHLFSGI